MQCSKNIDIMDGNVAAPFTQEPTKSKCDIEVSNYKEVKVSERIVSFFPNVTNDAYKYSWTATYSNGETMSSTEKVPQFPYSKENGLTRVNVKVTSSKCMRDFSKTYDANFWKFF